LLQALACSSANNAIYKARSIDTVEVYKDYLQSYPDSRYADWVKERIIILNDEKIFQEYEARNSVAAYKEFLDRYPKNKYVEIALDRLNASEHDEFERIYKLGTIQAFEEFIKRFPNSAYIPEIRNRIKWLKEIKIAVPHLSDKERLKVIEDAFRKSPYTAIYFENLSETSNDNIPVIMDLSSFHCQKPSHDPDKTKRMARNAGTQAALGAISGGVPGAVVGGLFGAWMEEGNCTQGRLIISSNNLKNKFEYDIVAIDATEERLLNNDFLRQIKKAEFITWLANSPEIPVAFLKITLRFDSDYFPDDHFRVAIVSALGAHDKLPVELILPFLNDKSYNVQLNAVQVLKKTRDPRSIEGLISALTKNDWCEPGLNSAGISERCKSMLNAMKEMTGVNIDSPHQWIDWWDKNKQFY